MCKGEQVSIHTAKMEPKKRIKKHEKMMQGRQILERMMYVYVYQGR